MIPNTHTTPLLLTIAYSYIGEWISNWVSEETKYIKTVAKNKARFYQRYLDYSTKYSQTWEQLISSMSWGMNSMAFLGSQDFRMMLSGM